MNVTLPKRSVYQGEVFASSVTFVPEQTNTDYHYEILSGSGFVEVLSNGSIKGKAVGEVTFRIVSDEDPRVVSEDYTIKVLDSNFTMKMNPLEIGYLVGDKIPITITTTPPQEDFEYEMKIESYPIGCFEFNPTTKILEVMKQGDSTIMAVSKAVPSISSQKLLTYSYNERVTAIDTVIDELPEGQVNPKVGDVFRLIMETTPPDQIVTYDVARDGIIEISSEGDITALKAGTTQLGLWSNLYKTTFEITVTEDGQ